MNSENVAKVLEITSPSGNVAEKPCIFLEGGIHSREWIATSTVLYIAGVGREDASHAISCNHVVKGAIRHKEPGPNCLEGSKYDSALLVYAILVVYIFCVFDVSVLVWYWYGLLQRRFTGARCKRCCAEHAAALPLHTAGPSQP